MTIGEYMRQAREDIGLTRPQLAKLSGVSENAIGLYERGEALPGILALVKLADAMEISIDDYIGHEVK